MPSSTASIMAAAFAFISATNAHMMMKTPAPYGQASLNNSPLDASGSDFPCKQRPGVYDPASSKNVMPIGASQTLSFTGSAVHGGGSCQIALTKDLKPTKDSKWMVIHSIEGGCPAKAAGNLGSDPNGSGASTFQYKIPDGISAGDYTLAWTWFNRIGNREMYMNCAPVTVTGGSKKRDLDDESFNATETYASDEIFKRDTSFPDLFKANIPSSACSTPDSKDIAFPNPGASVEKAGDPQNMGQPTGPQCGSSSGSSASSSGSSGSSSGSSGSSSSSSGNSNAAPAAIPSASSPSASSAPATGATSATPSTTSVVAIPPQGAPGASQAGAAMSVASAAQSVASAAASVVSSPSSGTSSSGSSSGSSSSSGGAAAAGSSSGSCSSPGAMVCSADGKQFGVCGQGGAVTMQPVAAGTSCKNGQIGFARSVKFARAFRA